MLVVAHVPYCRHQGHYHPGDCAHSREQHLVLSGDMVAAAEGFLEKMSPELSPVGLGQPKDSKMKKQGEGHSKRSITFFHV